MLDIILCSHNELLCLQTVRVRGALLHAAPSGAGHAGKWTPRNALDGSRSSTTLDSVGQRAGAVINAIAFLLPNKTRIFCQQETRFIDNFADLNWTCITAFHHEIHWQRWSLCTAMSVCSHNVCLCCRRYWTPFSASLPGETSVLFLVRYCSRDHDMILLAFKPAIHWLWLKETKRDKTEKCMDLRVYVQRRWNLKQNATIFQASAVLLR